MERLAGHPGIGDSSRTAKLTVSFSTRTAARRRREDERERLRDAIASLDAALLFNIPRYPATESARIFANARTMLAKKRIASAVRELERLDDGGAL